MVGCRLPRWQLDLGTQGIRSLVDRPAGPPGRDLENQAIRIGEVDAFEVDPVVGTGDRDPAVDKPAFPLQQRVAVPRLEGEVMRTTNSVLPSGGACSLEEGQDARPILLVSKIEVI